jgi:hypothetical protein
VAGTRRGYYWGGWADEMAAIQPPQLIREIRDALGRSMLLLPGEPDRWGIDPASVTRLPGDQLPPFQARSRSPILAPYTSRVR